MTTIALPAQPKTTTLSCVQYGSCFEFGGSYYIFPKQPSSYRTGDAFLTVIALDGSMFRLALTSMHRTTNVTPCNCHIEVTP